MSKLVRDDIPHIIYASGKRPITHKAIGDRELLLLLLDKLGEETKEVQEAKDRYELIQELADVYEVISCIALTVNCNIKDIEDVARVKRNTRGSFKKGIVLDEVKDAE